MTDLKIRTLLIVDDEPELLSYISDEVTNWGIKAETAINMQEAITIISEKNITAALSDISMPNGSGLDLLNEVRKQGMEIPFVFLTGNYSKKYILEAMQLGAIDFLEKPFRSDELEKVVMKVLEIGTRIQEIQELEKSSKTKNKKKMLTLLKLKNHHERKKSA